MADHFAHTHLSIPSLSPAPHLPLSFPFPSLYFLLHVFPFPRPELPSFSISISLSSSLGSLPTSFSLSFSLFLLDTTESLYIFRELLSSYFINIVLRVPPCIVGKGRIELHKRVMAVKMKKSFLV